MFKTVKLAGLVAVAAAGLALAPNAFARHGADDPAGHVRQEDRQADKTADKAADKAADRATDVRREDRATEARHGADDKPGDVRGGHGKDDPAGHQ
jgi:hypothetical protein